MTKGRSPVAGAPLFVTDSRRGSGRETWRSGLLLGLLLGLGGGALLDALVEVVEAGHGIGLVALAEAGILGAVLGGEDLVDELGAGAELVLHVAEDGVEAEELGVGDALQATALA